MVAKNASYSEKSQKQPLSIKIKNTVISILMIFIGFFVGNYIVFPYIVDPLFVPIIGMRPVLAAFTVIIFAIPGLYWAKYNHSF